MSGCGLEGEARRRKTDVEGRRASATYLRDDEDEASHPGLSGPGSVSLVCRSGSTGGVNIQVSYHVRTSDVLTHLQGDQVSLLKADTAVDQQERPHEAGKEENPAP